MRNQGVQQTVRKVEQAGEFMKRYLPKPSHHSHPSDTTTPKAPHHKCKHRRRDKGKNIWIILYCIFTCLSCLYLETQCFYPIALDRCRAHILTVLSYVIVGMALWSYAMTILVKNSLPKVNKIPNQVERQSVKDQGFPDYLSEACEHCQYYKPPRVSHCTTCGTCIMKMDHHCVWAQNCVGYRNQKSFYLFTFYMSLGLLQYWTATIEAQGTIYETNYEFSFQIVILWMITSISALFVGVMILVLWVIHSAMVLTNHVTLMNIKSRECFPLPFCQHRKSTKPNPDDYLNKFDRGEIQNIRSLFGTRGILYALLPTVRPLEHDLMPEACSPAVTELQEAKYTGFWEEELLIEKEMIRLLPNVRKLLQGQKLLVDGVVVEL